MNGCIWSLKIHNDWRHIVKWLFVIFGDITTRKIIPFFVASASQSNSYSLNAFYYVTWNYLHFTIIHRTSLASSFGRRSIDNRQLIDRCIFIFQNSDCCRKRQKKSYFTKCGSHALLSINWPFKTHFDFKSIL